MCCGVFADDCCGTAVALLWAFSQALSLKPLEKKRLAKAAESVHSSDLPFFAKESVTVAQIE